MDTFKNTLSLSNNFNGLNTTIYLWLGFLVLALTVALLFPLFKTNYKLEEHLETKFKNWQSCNDCCNKPENYELSNCIKNCTIEGNPCFCCNLHYKKRGLERTLKFFRPTTRTSVVQNIKKGTKIEFDDDNVVANLSNRPIVGDVKNY